MFNENNTYWVEDDDGQPFLRCNNIEEIAEDNGITLDRAYEELSKYEELSSQAVEDGRAWEETKRELIK